MGGLTVQGLREAVMEGALLRLRPKIMTVSTVVAVYCPSCGLRAPEPNDEAARYPCTRWHGQLSSMC